MVQFLSIHAGDDFTASRTIDAAAPGEATTHDETDALTALVQASGPGVGIRFRKGDVIGACTTMRLRALELMFAVATQKMPDGPLQATQLFGCPCGAIANLHAWHRCGAEIQEIQQLTLPCNLLQIR